jgi:addiction module HigA family antidote
MPREIPLALPGEILLEEFMKPLGVTQYRLAKEIRMPPWRINEIVHGKRAITADTALRLSASSATTRGAGSICRPTTTSKPHARDSQRHSPGFVPTSPTVPRRRP